MNRLMDRSSASHVAVPDVSTVSRETLERLRAHTDLVLKWNGRLNLIARGDEQNIWPRHVEDCLQLVPFVPATTGSAIDIGSGGGFPGLILSIAIGVPFQLVESDKRKAAFLREAVRVTQAPATVLATRVEHFQATADLVTARAVSPLRKLLGLAYPKLSPTGVCLFLKGRTAEAELAEARTAWSMVVEASASSTSALATVLRISGLTPR